MSERLKPKFDNSTLKQRFGNANWFWHVQIGSGKSFYCRNVEKGVRHFICFIDRGLSLIVELSKVSGYGVFICCQFCKPGSSNAASITCITLVCNACFELGFYMFVSVLLVCFYVKIASHFYGLEAVFFQNSNKVLIEEYSCFIDRQEKPGILKKLRQKLRLVSRQCLKKYGFPAIYM